MPHQCIPVFCMISRASWNRYLGLRNTNLCLTSIERNFAALQHSISNLRPNHPGKHLSTYVLSRLRKHTNGGHRSARAM
ncbi:hypothetical protein L208DRAFT_1394612 [Tricholoma matsutake]|nr:hypothetical protein L208DRAFT_1394612 [Tricholoma matsutake 945]